MENRIIECIPNFSEGRDNGIIGRITSVIESVKDISLLNVDTGRDANRSVITFSGTPESVSEAAFLSVRRASELIDMRQHHGRHPRIGATDVLPFVPLSGITMAETVLYAREVAARIGDELQIPVYCYGDAAFTAVRKNLANCRAGEYEGLTKKLEDPLWKPDYGPSVMNVRSGATAVGARGFLVAFNVNLDTSSVEEARAIAAEVRESGGPLRKGESPEGEIVRDKNGKPLWKPGSLKSVRAIGWYMPEYRFTQVSMNLTDIAVTPVHTAYEEVRRKAAERGIRVTGSELVGLIPAKAILDAGRYYARERGEAQQLPDDQIIDIAVSSLGLNHICEFIPEKRVIEMVMAEG